MPISRTGDGVYAIAPTSCVPGGSIGYTSIDRMVDFDTWAGISGSTVRKYVFRRRGVLEHEAQRARAGQLSASARM
ncbi:hypothetical protein [Nocardia brevicatena]|uniref:hypothetical protein n=1 Tax=Nocardia brevicatena TaxID=37327 RepID=UPI00031F1C6E|nr:hypothetical protein [Nocardia brevicatena]